MGDFYAGSAQRHTMPSQPNGKPVAPAVNGTYAAPRNSSGPSLQQMFASAAVPSHTEITRKTWAKLNALKEAGTVTIDGDSLDIPTVVAVAR